MSRKGNCYDNAIIESFFRTLKAKCVDQHVFYSHAYARSRLFELVEVYYNRQRLHSTLGYHTPLAFEAIASLTTFTPHFFGASSRLLFQREYCTNCNKCSHNRRIGRGG